jgi:hypothetical protein
MSEPSHTQTYAMDAERAAPYLRKSLRTSVMFYGILTVIVLAIVNRGDFSRAGLFGLAGGATTAGLVFGLLIWSNARTSRRQIETFRLTIDDQTIHRTAAQVPDVSLRRADIIRIEDYPGTGMRLCTADQRMQIFIPVITERYDELKKLLTDNHPVTQKQSQGTLLLQCALWALGTMGAFAALFTATSIPVVVGVGLGIIAVVTGIAIYIQRLSSIPAWSKAFYWLSVPIAIVLLLLRLRALL